MVFTGEWKAFKVQAVKQLMVADVGRVSMEALKSLCPC